MNLPMACGFRQKTQDFESRDQDFTALAEKIVGASAYLQSSGLQVLQGQCDGPRWMLHVQMVCVIAELGEEGIYSA